MNHKARAAVYAAIEKRVEAHLKFIMDLLNQEPLTDAQIKEALQEAMNLLRQPIYH
jgi:hypothetical protein